MFLNKKTKRKFYYLSLTLLFFFLINIIRSPQVFSSYPVAQPSPYGFQQSIAPVTFIPPVPELDHFLNAVNIINGNLIIYASSMHLPGELGETNIFSFYNSQDISSNFLGAGWSVYPARRLNISYPNGVVDFPEYVIEYEKDRTSDVYNLIEVVPGIKALYEYKQLGDHRKLLLTSEGEAWITYKDLTKARFNKLGNLIEVRGATGALGLPYTRFHYDEQGKLIEVETPSRMKTKYYYENIGGFTRLVSIRGPVGLPPYKKGKKRESIPNWQIDFQYDNQGRLIRILGPEEFYGKYYTYEYDEKNRLKKVKVHADRDLWETEYQYDDQNRLIKIIETPPGYETTYTYIPEHRQVRVTDPGGSLTLYAYNEKGYLTYRCDAEMNEVRYSYDERGNITKEIDENGTQTLYYYNDNNDLIKRVIKPPSDVYGEEIITEYTYDDKHRLLSLKDPEGYITRFTYIGNTAYISKIEKTRNPNTLSFILLSQYTYDLVGNLTSVTDAQGNKTEYFYEGDTEIGVDPESGKMVKVKNYLLGYVTRIKYPRVQVKSETGRLSSADYQEFINYQYLFGGLRKSVTDPRGFTTTYEYDILGRLRKIIYPPQDIEGTLVHPQEDIDYTHIFYSPPLVPYHGCLTKIVTDKEGRQTHYSYDRYDRLVRQNSWGYYKEIDPQTGEIREVIKQIADTYSYSYTDFKGLPGYLKKVHRHFIKPPGLDPPEAEGVTTTYIYDRIGRLKETQKSVSSISSIGSTGSIIKTYNTYKESYHYRKRTNIGDIPYFQKDHRATHLRVVTSPKANTSDEPLKYSTIYEYDYLGRLIRVTDPYVPTHGRTYETYKYDKLGNKIETIDRQGYKTTYTYDFLGRRIKEVFPDNTKKEYVYDLQGNLITEKLMDSQGEIKSQTDYEYDSLSRLITTIYPEVPGSSPNTPSIRYNEDYGYDAVGNRVWFKDRNGNITRYFYDSLSHLTKVLGPKIDIYYIDPQTQVGVKKEQNVPNIEIKYDLNGNKTKIIQKRGDKDLTYNYIYDNQNRLIKAFYPCPRRTTKI